jgi:dihydroorotase
MHEGYYSTILGLNGIPAASEETMVARDVILAEMTGGHLHIGHVSTRGAVDAIRVARARGIRVTCEATPHHLVLTDAEVRGFSTNVKMNPPLRSEDHRQALIEALADGTIDAIATDHAPHHFDEKNVEFDLAPFGVTGLETAFPVVHDRLVTTGAITITRLIELLSSGPAAVFSLLGGTLRAGSIGDVTIVDLEGRTHVGNFASRASNSPFTGLDLKGRVAATVVGGAIRYLDREALRAPVGSSRSPGGSRKRRKK